MEQKFLLPGDLVTTRKPMQLSTLLGSCVSICLSNPSRGLAGMNHYLLPEATAGADPNRYGDTSIRFLLQSLFALDADPRHYRARVYGGGKVVGHLGALGDIGARNVEVARRLLREWSIAIQYESVAGNQGRRIDFNTQTDVVDCRTVGAGGSVQRSASSTTRVLIVDDSPVARRLLKTGLARCAGIDVVGEAGDAFAAREQVLSLDPDVLTLDVEMPRLDGITFLEQLMKHFPKPVVVMSSLATPGSALEARARAAGAFEVFDKQRFEAKDPMAVVQQVVGPMLLRARASHPGAR